MNTVLLLVMLAGTLAIGLVGGRQTMRSELMRKYARFENGIWVHFVQDGAGALKIGSVENHTAIPVSFDSKMAKQPN